MRCKQPLRLWEEDFCPFAPIQEDFERSACRSLFVARSQSHSATTCEVESRRRPPYSYEQTIKAIRYLTQHTNQELDAVLIGEVDVVTWASTFTEHVVEKND